MLKVSVSAIIILLVISSAITAQEEKPVWISVARSDSTLVPFALWNEGSWSNPWPGHFEPTLAKDRKTPVNIKYTSLTEIPESWYAPFMDIPIIWYMRKINGGSDKVSISKPYPVECWCVALWGLLFDTAQPPQFVHRAVPFYGIALSSDLPAQYIHVIPKESALWGKCFSLIQPEFNEAENESDHPLNLETRNKVEMSIKLFRGDTEKEGEFIVYFEALKEYYKHDLMDIRSDFSTSFFSGWILYNNSNGELIFLKKGMVFDSYMTIYNPMINPLGIVKIGEKTYWIVQNRYYEGESYQIIEVSVSGIHYLLKVYAGGC